MCVREVALRALGMAASLALVLGLPLAAGAPPVGEGDGSGAATGQVKKSEIPPQDSPAATKPESIKPLPLPPIPDDPPPHEGALIDVPYVIEPPDLLIVEVLVALPGRPISGERLVRPDGSISLGFYGDVHVRGLSLRQAKIKIVEHLRAFLSDEMLGLQIPQFEEEPQGEMKAKPGSPGVKGAQEPVVPSKPSAGRRPTPGKAPGRLRRTSGQEPGIGSSSAPDLPSIPHLLPARPASGRVDELRTTVLKPGAGGRIRIAVGLRPAAEVPKVQSNPVVPPGEPVLQTKSVPPAETDRVFVDVTAHNSQYYYVEGDVSQPGKLPCTGGDTVLDAILYTGSLTHTADRQKIQLFRPARGASPAKSYHIDLDAIEHGQARSNLQLFPGDRLVVGRDVVVGATLDQDRQAAALQSLVNSMLQATLFSRSLAQATPDLTPKERERLVRECVDFWLKASKQTGDPAAKEAAFRELLLDLIRQTRAPAEAGNPPKK